MGHPGGEGGEGDPGGEDGGDGHSVDEERGEGHDCITEYKTISLVLLVTRTVHYWYCHGL